MNFIGSNPSTAYTKNMRQIYNYYTTMLSSPITMENANNLRPWRIYKIKIFFYCFTRFLIAAVIFHNSLLFFGAYTFQFGPLDVFGKLEAVLWLLAYFLCFVGDAIILQPKFTCTLLQFMGQCDLIWEHASNAMTIPTIAVLSHQLNRQWKIIFGHNSLLDYYQTANFAWQLWGTLSYQTNVYSLYPWKNEFAETVAWFLTVSGIAPIVFTYSFLLVFHGMYAYHLNTCIRAMDMSIPDAIHNSKYSLESILQDYKSLRLSSRLVGSHVRYILLIVYVIAGAQQTAESYIVFKMIKLGAGGTDMMFLLLDLGFTLSRITHSLFSLSSVDLAVMDFWKNMRRSFASSHIPSRRRKLLMRVFRGVKPIKMMIGPIQCHNNLLLDGLATYTDYYTAAALSP